MSVQGTGLATSSAGSAVNKLPQVVDGSVTEITAADLTGITQIRKNAFHDCAFLTTVEIPYGVTRIDDSAFGYCSNLRSITIPNSVTTIGMYSFNNCVHLVSVMLPPSVTSIAMYAFGYCPDLASVTIEATTPPSLSSATAFNSNAPNRIIYVPAASVDAYKAATNWSAYADKIQAIPS